MGSENKIKGEGMAVSKTIKNTRKSCFFGTSGRYVGP